MQTEIQDEGLLAQAAALAGATVAIVKHSGRRGTRQEFEELLLALEAAKAEHPDNPYLQAIINDDTRAQINDFAEIYTEVPKQSEVNDFKLAALNRCGQAAEWLSANASPEAAAEVKHSIIEACRRVAGASKESGLLNLTADNIDALEVSTIEEVVRALGADKPTA